MQFHYYSAIVSLNKYVKMGVLFPRVKHGANVGGISPETAPKRIDRKEQNAVRERLKKKIRSNRGASIVIALMLFLVCAAVGAVVLTAGTAAAGRASQQEKMDRRYYSVLSAAELVRDQLDGQSYTVVRTKTVTSSESGTFDPKSVPIPGPGGTEYASKCTYKNGAGSVSRSDSLLSEAIYQYIFGSAAEYVSGYNNLDAYNAGSFTGNATEDLATLTLTPGSDALPVQMTVGMLEDGSLRITLVNLAENGDPAPAGSVFTMELTVSAVFSDNSDSPSRYSNSETVTSDTGYTTTTTTVYTKTSKLEWKAGAIRVVSETADA